MEWFIREATGQDYAGLCELFAEIDALHAEALPHVFQVVEGPVRTRAYILSIIADPEAGLFVAESEGQIVGAVDIRIHEAPAVPIFRPRHFAFVDAIIVRGTHQRSGIGLALMEQAYRWARDNGLDQVALNVWEFNQGAIAFYEQLGYTTTSRRMWRRLPCE